MSKKRKPDAKPSASGFVSERKKEGAEAELLPRTAEAKRSEFLLTCDGCQFLRFEDRPHGIKAARCANPEAGNGTIRGFGRTLEIFGTGEIGPVVRPVWCRGLPQSLCDSKLGMSRRASECSLKEGADKERRVV